MNFANFVSTKTAPPAFEVVRPPDPLESEADLSAHCRIYGVDFHMTFIAVKEDDEFNQAPVEPENPRYEALQDFEDTGKAFQTVTIGGKPYVVVLTPFCE